MVTANDTGIASVTADAIASCFAVTESPVAELQDRLLLRCGGLRLELALRLLTRRLNGFTSVADIGGLRRPGDKRCDVADACDAVGNRAPSR